MRDTALDDAFKSRDSIVGQQIQSVMAVPLQTNDRVIGLVNVDSRSFARPFTPDDLDLLTVIANVAAIRIENERLNVVEHQKQMISRELEQAAAIQRRLLPREAPIVPGYQIAGSQPPVPNGRRRLLRFLSLRGRPDRARPGRRQRKGDAGGDPDERGQGGVQVLFGETPDDVASLMSRLDRVVAANFPRNRFVTLFFGLLDPATGELTYCNAGHNPPFLIRADDSVERLTSCGTILGIFPDMSYEVKHARLDPGDVLTLFSDGVTEENNPSGESSATTGSRASSFSPTRRNKERRASSKDSPSGALVGRRAPRPPTT
mgnify:CR=1 FL=1